MDLSVVLRRWYTPLHNGNSADPEPYRVRLAALSTGSHVVLVAAIEAVTAALNAADEAGLADAMQVWSDASSAALDCVIGVEGLSEGVEPVTVERYREVAVGLPELSQEIVRTIMAGAKLGGAQGKV